MLKYKFFIILTDFYGKITDEIDEIFLSLEEAARRREAGQYLFNNYADALECVAAGE